MARPDLKTLFVTLSATVFYIGYVPYISGTAASLVAVILAWFWGPGILAMIVVSTVIGFLVARPSQQVLRSIDPSSFVLDEVSGMLIALVWLPQDWRVYLAGFVVFRILDTWKPWPISICQKNRHPHDIMWDDVWAGVFTNLFLQVLTRFVV